MNRWFRELREPAGLPWVPLRDLRHACAQRRRRLVRTIMETLGHSQISVTADLYAHVPLPTQRAASDAAEAALFGEDKGDEDGSAGVLAGR